MNDKEPVKFLFEPPLAREGVSELGNVALQMAAISSRLAQENRTRVEHADGRAENVAEHSLALAKVAPELAERLYPELDANLVARFATVHDDVEAYVGDTPTDRITPGGLMAKEELETSGLERLRVDFAHMPSYVKLVEAYEVQQLPEARFTRVADKLMPVLVHFGNRGKVLKEEYAYESVLASSRAKAAGLREKYPEFEALISLREELSELMVQTFLAESGDPGHPV